jgi:hypothetical protein
MEIVSQIGRVNLNIVNTRHDALLNHESYVHPAVISPIVCQSNDKLHASLLCRLDDLVKRRKIDLLGPVRPPLHHIGTGTCTFTAILRKTIRKGGAILCIEAPCTHGVQPGFLCGGKASFDVRLELYTVRTFMNVKLTLAVVKICSRRDIFLKNNRYDAAYTYIVEGEVVCVTTSEIKVLPIELEHVAIGRDKSSWGFFTSYRS